MSRLKNGLIVIATLLSVGSYAQAGKPAYHIRTRDVVSVMVVGERDLSLDMAVLDDGTVSYPYAGHFTAQGLTVAEFRVRIVKGLKKIIRDPEVTVTISHSRPLMASGVGAFLKPSSVEVVPNMTLLDLVAQCSGLAPGLRPEWVQARLVRGHNVKNLDFSKLVNGDPSQNQPLEDGDVLLVSEGNPDGRFVKVLGEVAKPGALIVGGNSTFASILAQAGGATAHASLRSAVLTHGTTATQIDLSHLVVDGKEPDGLQIAPGDTLLIPTSTAHYLVLGSILQPGVFDVPETQKVDLLSAMSRAGGLGPEADLRWVYIMRRASYADPAKDATVQEPEKIDMRHSLLSGALAKIEIHEGDVVYVPSRKPALGFKDLAGVISAAVVRYFP